MPHQRTPVEQVSHLVKLYHRGIICPTHMWDEIAEALTPENATAVLNSLSPEVKEQLRDVWIGRPPAAYIPRADFPHYTPEFQATCVQVVRWCEASGPLDRPTEDDGLIRVCIENGVVQRWQA